MEQVFTLIVEKQDAAVMKSPSRTPVSIVSIPRESSHWKQIVSPVTPEFFASFTEFFGDTPVPEHWKHFRGALYAGPDGKIGCVACEVEAVTSNDGSNFLCPKRNQYGDVKVRKHMPLILFCRIQIILTPIFRALVKLRKKDALPS